MDHNEYYGKYSSQKNEGQVRLSKIGAVRFDVSVFNGVYVLHV